MALHNIEWFHQIIRRICVSDSQSELLTELKVALSTLNAADLASVAAAVSLSPIFDCVNTSDRIQLELACEILGKLLAVLEPRLVLAQYGPQIQRTLVHPAPHAKELVLRELDRAVATHVEMVQRLSAEQALVVSVVNCLTHEETSVARHAIAVLQHLGSCSPGLSLLYSPAILEALNVAISKGDVVRFRVYEVVVAVSIESEEGLMASERSGFLSKLVSELKRDDVLTQLNVLEMLTSMALCQHGLTYLDQQGILNYLADKLMKTNNDPLASFLIPGLIKFFGNVAQAKPDEIMERFPTLVSMMFETLESADTTLMAVGMETIAYIASTLKGKYVLHSLGDKVPETLRRIAEKLTIVPMDVRIRLLNSVSNVLQLKVPDQNNQSLSMTKRWFEALSRQPMDFIMSICRQPFPEMRLAGFQLMQILAINPWGQEYIARAPGVIEYLLDRSTEPIKTCQDSKFDIVKTLVTSPSSPSVLSPDVLERLNEFLRQGEYFLLGETEVAIEGAS